MGWGAAVSGIAGGASSMIGSLTATLVSDKWARRQMDFQERMANTAYQRAMKDMRKAGLNPILAYQQGGAAVPAGARAKMENPLAGAASSAMGLARLAQELKNMKAVEARERAAERKERKLGDLYGAESHVAGQRQWILRMQRLLMESQIPTAKQLEAWTRSEEGQRWNKWKFARERAIGGGSPSGWINPVLRGLGR